MSKRGDTVAFSHNGGQQGTSTLIAVLPAQKVGIVVLINMEAVDEEPLSLDLLKILKAGAK